MKKLIFFFFFICFASSQETNIEKNFFQYWTNIKNNKIRINYDKYEMPYQKFLFSYKHYIELVKKYEKNIKIIKIKHIKCIRNKCLINYLGYNEKYHYKFSDTDIWYNIQNKWYHYFKYEKLF